MTGDGVFALGGPHRLTDLRPLIFDPAWATKYVGLPFVESGFSFSGCHCWGLVCLAYETEFGVTLPRHDTIGAKQLLAMAKVVERERLTAPWTAVTGPRQDFDVVLMMQNAMDESGRLRRFPSHIGLAVGTGRVLHVESTGIETVCVSDKHPSIRFRIAGTYRHETLK